MAGALAAGMLAGFLAGIGASVLPVRPASAQVNAVPEAKLPLLTWDLLRRTVYRPMDTMTWPDSLRLVDGKQVRLEGYVLPNFGAQDASDVLLSANHPSSLYGGPTDMTAIIEVYMPGFDPTDWPQLPVEMIGTFHLSKNPRDLRAIYRLSGTSWRPLRRWVQDFPGAIQEQQDSQDDGGP
jgi:hypothetical protein